MPESKGKKGFSAEEKAAMRARIKEEKEQVDRESGEAAVLAAIAAMPPPDRAMGERLHRIIKSAGPNLAARTWYGMPAYTKDGEVVIYYQPASKFKVRYGTLGFSDEAKLDEGRMWPIAYALPELTPSDEARIHALVKKAIA